MHLHSNIVRRMASGPGLYEYLENKILFIT